MAERPSLSPGDGRPQGAPLDRYVVLEYLAEGGMGAIYLGKKLGAGGFEKEVVLKQLLPEFTRQPEFIDLFLREARLSATLDHANIIHTIDLVTAGDEYFIVMEYLPGADLRSLLKRIKRRRRRLKLSAALYIAREVLSALAYAHAKAGNDGRPLKLIHRDISPSNVLISRNGEVKLTDFGIAKASTHNSVFYRVKGKVGYMSPEQARSEPLDSRSDLYSLAVCLYEMITGERLFVSAGLTTSANDIYNQPVPMISRKVEGCPVDLDKVMLRALSIDPNARYQTAGELQEALLRIAHRHGLMMAAPELAEHLRDVAGNPDHWRLDSSTSHAGASFGGGTEIYEPDEGTEQIDYASVAASNSADLIEVVDDPDDVTREASLVDASAFRKRRQLTSVTNLTRLQHLELTSMINLAEVGDAGARPLVDLDALDDDSLADARDETGPSSIEGIAKVAGRDDDSSGAMVPLRDLPALAADEDSVDFSEPEPPARYEPAGMRRPWLIIGLILLAGVGVAAAIGLTGPDLEATVGDPPAAGLSGEAPDGGAE